MSILQRLQARVQRWHLLGRYYVNKWHYNGSKWVECVLYGQGMMVKSPHVASVAFMITRAMRQQLLDAGFPSSAISSLQPGVAQKLIADKITFDQFEEIKKKHQVEEAAKKAKQVLRQEEEEEQQQGVQATAERQLEAGNVETVDVSIALVGQPKRAVKKEENMKKRQR